MNVFFLLAVIGHILCGVSDCLLTYAPNGKVSLTDFKDYNKSSVSFKSMPLRNLNIAMLLGFIAMVLEIFGYLEICNWIHNYSTTLYWIMYSSTLIMFVSLTLHHLFCCLCEWFFVRLNLTKEALNSVWDFFKTTVYTILCTLDILPC